jgi:hypothetical protein
VSDLFSKAKLKQELDERVHAGKVGRIVDFLLVASGFENACLLEDR